MMWKRWLRKRKNTQVSVMVMRAKAWLDSATWSCDLNFLLSRVNKIKLRFNGWKHWKWRFFEIGHVKDSRNKLRYWWTILVPVSLQWMSFSRIHCRYVCWQAFKIALLSGTLQTPFRWRHPDDDCHFQGNIKEHENPRNKTEWCVIVSLCFTEKEYRKYFSWSLTRLIATAKWPIHNQLNKLKSWCLNFIVSYLKKEVWIGCSKT